ncbi:alpha/beta fold hydrolase [Nonomuraea sp. PA05]|uniref:alpha/beta fold hydrolase n=1 Tax=Nonomuraea sp. PA05 TaxID=2604466 RepID=UPI0011D9937F|nr:alpha/beta fold hydrolase [Nonomuraea sp. PA05]TYB61069.1 alpha/beta fold hydrolase [Nonomuraea sp. PA05]
MERRLFVLAAGAFIVAAVLGSAWVTGQFTTPTVDRTEGYVSELAAVDQPWTRLFRISDVLSGLACLAGVALVPRVSLKCSWEWAGWLALAAFGLLTATAGLFPLDCAALSDPLCGQRGTSPAHVAHALARVLGTGAVLGAMMLLSARWAARASWLFTWLTLAATLLTVITLAVGRGVGLAHRAQLTAIAVWLVYVALRLLVADEPDEAGPRIAPGRLGGVGGARVRADDAPAWSGDGGGGGSGAERASGACAAAGPATADPVTADPVTADPVTAAGGGGGEPHVVVQGEGPAVLITAGLAGAWFHWDAVAARLAAGHRVIRFDRPGLGLSPCAPAPPTLYGEAARLAALSPAHPQQVTLVAHGVACWHAEAFARLHPLCLARLVLVEPACAGERRPLPFALTAGRWLPALGRTWGAAALARLTGPPAHRLLAGVPDPSGVYGTGRVLAAVAGEWLALRRMALDLRALRAEKPFPDVPVTVLTSGDPDGRVERLAGELGAEHVHLPQTGPRLQLRAPQAVADAVAPA